MAHKAGGSGQQGNHHARMGGTHPTGRWPQFRTIQEKEVTILNNKECDNFYHKFTKISSLIRIINSQMICAKDTHREQFCYVSTCPLVHSPPRHPARSGARGMGGGGRKERRERVGRG